MLIPLHLLKNKQAIRLGLGPSFFVWRKPPAMLVVQESLQRGKKNNLPSGKLSVGFPTTQKEPGRYPYEKGQ